MTATPAADVASLMRATADALDAAWERATSAAPTAAAVRDLAVASVLAQVLIAADEAPHEWVRESVEGAIGTVDLDGAPEWAAELRALADAEETQ